jgi:hypothetical protein
MTRPRMVLLIGCALAFSAIVGAQGTPRLAGTWKLATTNPPVAAGRGGGGGAPGPGGPYGATTFTAAPESLVITQTASDVTVQIGATKEVFTLDDKTTEAPVGDVNALKTRAHWEGAKLHLHYKQAMNFGRDVLSVNGDTLTMLRDLETGGQSTTRTMTYTKVQ